ncbi:DUF4974 domain-containing protein [Fulvivirgaceae bacterium BMA12]|uniref:DUF4974 domain-containing protein n=1 Tax=Agaribacillus aureus TaxID=3051825 RepID=A0ABT8L6F0_9BACT|nr:DUF4974 domain-containing protein [Fulvivirgaceae bacterium BMA12]
MEYLIFKYLNKNLTEAEKQQLTEWLQKDKVNRKVFENMVAEWSLKTSDIERSKRSIYHNIVGASEAKPRKGGIFSSFIKVAAALAVVLTATFLIVRLNQQNENNKVEHRSAKIERVALPGQKLRMKLPDGTEVVLNSDSRLVTEESYDGAVRKVFLEGEAFFDVVEDASKPFIVETNATNVAVLGTSFNVRCYDDEENVSVAVNTGKVSVSDRDDSDEHFILKNEMLVYSIKDKLFNKLVNFDRELVFGWKDQHLVFEDESIEKIFKQLSRWYDVKFKVLANIDREKRFTARFQNQTLETVMKSISFNYEFDYEINEKEIIIK